MPGYIYLLMMADGVYKVGRTQQDYGPSLNRMKSYPRDSVLVFVKKVQNEKEYEKKVLAIFRKKFVQHVRGCEYFTGDENQMMDVIYNTKQDECVLLPIYRYVEGILTVIHNVKISEGLSRVYELDWYEHPKTHQIYTTREGVRVYLQDVIKGPKGPWVHVNGDPNDYRDQNLLKTTTNVRTVKRKESTSKTVGVCYVERRNRWKATLSGKLIGYFKTEEEAADARYNALLHV